MIRRIRYLVAFALFALVARWTLEAIRAATMRPGAGPVVAYATGAMGERLALRVSPLTPAELAAQRQLQPVAFAAAWAAATTTSA